MCSSDLVVVLMPVTEGSPYVIQCAEPTGVEALVAETSMEAFNVSVRTHCQLHPHRRVQEDVSGLFILFIHGWDESLNWSSIAAHGARIDSFSMTREGA